MKVFENGSSWIKADFHLHTKADKEFKYDGEENNFVAEYIEKLKSTNIGIGVIANHNKYDIDEFKALRKKANKEEIFLLPGIELSVADGAKGIHCIVIFDYDSWIKNSDNFIEQFINSAFEGISSRLNKNARCNYSLLQLFNKLEEHRKSGRDSFVVMAHIEQENGFFNELDGGRIEELAANENFKKNVLGFQKIRTNDIKEKLSIWFKGKENIPAFVEGSDCKNMDEVGNTGFQKNADGNTVEKTCFLKLGDFNFESIKYSLIDKYCRVSNDTIPERKNAFIKSISFEGGLLDGILLNFSPELNNFIGIRGSGKSAIIEIIRYTLHIPLNTNSIDRDYKNGLIEHILKSGGKASITVINSHNEEYRIERILKQKEDIFKDNRKIDVSISAIFDHPIYFGQKDLSNKDIDFESDLIHKLIGNRLEEISEKIKNKTKSINDLVLAISKQSNLEEQRSEIKEQLKNAKHNLKLYKEKGVEKKLSEQADYNSEITELTSIKEGIEDFISQLEDVINNNSDFFSDYSFESKNNKKIFEEVKITYNNVRKIFNGIKTQKNKADEHLERFEGLLEKIIDKKESLKEEFAKIKREINIRNLNPDEFLKLKKSIDTYNLKLKSLDQSEKKRNEDLAKLNNIINELNQLWHEEFKIIEKEVKRINASESLLSIEVIYKGRKDKYFDKMKELFKGSGIRESSYSAIIEKYADFIEIYRDNKSLKKILNTNYQLEFDRRFNENLSALLTFKVDNKFTIKYKGKALYKHSLGQRASALILFLLAQKENDILIIDQPEDDLDNQTIYEEVIKVIKQLKGNMQFIFATHNANIPVLGDSEMVVSCFYSEDKIDIKSGTIDKHEIQNTIVNIMEGGQEAFERRKDIYSLWKL